MLYQPRKNHTVYIVKGLRNYNLTRKGGRLHLYVICSQEIKFYLSHVALRLYFVPLDESPDEYCLSGSDQSSP
jgi:hypothetical protein